MSEKSTLTLAAWRPECGLWAVDPCSRSVYRFRRRPAWSTCFLSELLVEILDDLPRFKATGCRGKPSPRPGRQL